jgi:ferric-dicitrate binding protein FerR (iron transport regulator)
VKAVLAWFQANKLGPEKEQELQALWQAASQVEEEGHTRDAGRIFCKIKEQIQEPQRPEQQETSNIIRFPQLHQQQFWFKVAAAVLLPLCLTWGLLRYTSGSKATTAVYMSVVAAPGVKKIINLSDGSVIRLNAGSKVAFPKHFAGDKREIQLHGEAFFEVAKDSLRPFIVHTGSLSTQALGTSFNINYDLFDDAITVALATGVVKVDKQEKDKKRKLTKLVPGQQLSYSKSSERYAVARFNRNEALGWMEGVLTFKKADMEQTVRKLENWYGVDIEVDTRGMEDEAWNYTGEYNNETLEKVLEGIGFVKGFTYERNENKVRIVFN